VGRRSTMEGLRAKNPRDHIGRESSPLEQRRQPAGGNVARQSAVARSAVARDGKGKFEFTLSVLFHHSRNRPVDDLPADALAHQLVTQPQRSGRLQRQAPARPSFRKSYIVKQSALREFSQHVIHDFGGNSPPLQAFSELLTAPHPCIEESIGNLDCLRLFLLPQAPSSSSQLPAPPPAPPEV